ncbi:outer membrane protein assembly factor BamE [Candidimonas nitroreducens]|uniref:outer membrane protein assembly factor BamE n=1 Tax=Candidimonas nitroreducens TaxID=683354 RepID=UPI001E3708CC|nr:outer membrane protein assembly factor BamE [Candidimonas nitroreducens]
MKTAKPLFPRLRAALALGVAAAALSACGTTNWGFPYRADVQQGNWITSEQVAQLRKGMTRDQVRYILGTPTLQDAFRSNRWDYPYLNKPGYGKTQERKFTVWFDGDLLDHWAGDPQPDRQPFQKADTGMTPADKAHDAKKPDQGIPTQNPNVRLEPVNPGASAVPGQNTPQPLR